jgi:hypothetical protein
MLKKISKFAKHFPDSLSMLFYVFSLPDLLLSLMEKRRFLGTVDGILFPEDFCLIFLLVAFQVIFITDALHISEDCCIK